MVAASRFVAGFRERRLELITTSGISPRAVGGLPHLDDRISHVFRESKMDA